MEDNNMNISLLRNVLRKVKKSIFIRNKILSPIEYWEERAKQYGKWSVINIGHSEDEVEIVTKMQKERIFPILRTCLNGNEKIILDFGCGPGRFIIDLAKIINGKAIGIDPIKYLLDMAPKNENVEYILSKEGEIPLADYSIDIVWSCSVLGGIKGDTLNRSVKEINRVLKFNGLLFIVENTSDKKDSNYWFYRSVSEYRNILSFATLTHIQDYYDLGERNSIMAGRKTTL